MKKRTFLITLLLILAMAAIFADTTVTITYTVSTRNSGGYYLTVTSISPSSGITLYYGTSSNNINSTITLDNRKSVKNSNTIYFKAQDSSRNTGTSNAINLSSGSGSTTITISSSSSGGGGGSGSGDNALAEEARLYYFPRSVINNSNVMVDLSTPNSMQASDFTETFMNYSEDNLALFRVREALSSNPNTETSSDSGTIAITIESPDGWTFVNENNYTRTTPFTIDVFCVEEAWNHLTNNNDYDYTTYTSQLGSSTTLPASNVSATLTYSGGYYTLVLPYTSYSQGVRRYYPAYIRSADICLNIPTFNPDLESGYYSTNLVVTIPAHTEYNASGTSSTVGAQVINITIRGYLGVDASSNGSSSFVVLSSTDTYTMDLGISANPANGYSVAQAKFVYNNVVEDLPDNADTKYTVYVSPTANYADTTSDFRFIKIGSESQARSDINTIYYTLDWTGKNSTPPYYMRPTFTSTQISSVSTAGTGRNSYLISWDMDNMVYLNLTSASLETNATHQEGMYYSYIYFTLVTND